MRIILACICCIGFGTLWSQEEEIDLKDKTVAPAEEGVPEEPAQFPGGKAALYRFLTDSLRYPQHALDYGIHGKCYVRFVVNTKGKVDYVRVVRGVPDCPECDAEAVRVVKAMPDWIPATQNGIAVNSYFNLPVDYRLILPETETPKTETK
jgi:periplasmic protein TonB